MSTIIMVIYVDAGMVYAEKMKHDYSTIQYKAAQEFKKRLRLPAVGDKNVVGQGSDGSLRDYD